MQTTRLSHSTRQTALGLAFSLVGVTFSPLALAQQTPPPAAAPTAPAPAAKAPDKKTRDSARKAYGDGEKAFSAGDFIAAQAAFETANSLIPSPQAEYWLAKSLDAQPEKVEDAIAAYEKFLANPDAAKAGDDKVVEAKSRVEALKASLEGVVEVVTVPPGATVSVDGTAQPGVTPLVLKLPPGTHKLSVSLADFEAKEIEAVVKGGEQTQEKIELTAVPPPPALTALPGNHPTIAPAAPVKPATVPSAPAPGARRPAKVRSAAPTTPVRAPCVAKTDPATQKKIYEGDCD